MGIAIADVSGHGPGAAVVMAMLRTVMSIDRVLNADPFTQWVAKPSAGLIRGQSQRARPTRSADP